MKLRIILGLLVVLLLVGCAAEKQQEIPEATETYTVTDDAETNVEASVESMAVSIDIRNIEPLELTVAPGTTVTWTKADTVNHRLVDNNGMFDSGSALFGEGKSFSYTYETEGIYEYRDLIMGGRGKIVVQ